MISNANLQYILVTSAKIKYNFQWANKLDGMEEAVDTATNL